MAMGPGAWRNLYRAKPVATQASVFRSHPRKPRHWVTLFDKQGVLGTYSNPDFYEDYTQLIKKCGNGWIMERGSLIRCIHFTVQLFFYTSSLLFIYWFFCCLFAHSIIFHSYGDVTIVGQGLKTFFFLVSTMRVPQRFPVFRMLGEPRVMNCYT